MWDYLIVPFAAIMQFFMKLFNNYALALMLYECEKECRSIPAASRLKDIETEENEFVTYITCDTLKYRKMHNNRAVKKTLTIPEWLNEEATARELNFSQILQEALRARLGLE